LIGEDLHVLVVDDDPRAVNLVSLRLERAGMSVTRAYGGADAIAALAAGSVGAVMLDLLMPEVSGFEVLSELKSNPATADLPVIILSAKVSDVAEREVLRHMAHAVSAKSGWDEREFLDTLQMALAQRTRQTLSVSSTLREGSQQQSRTEPRVVSERRTLMKSVLLVEDNAANRKLLGDLLRHAGHKVREVGNADAGIEAALAEPFDLVVMDIQLPGTDGLTATRLLRANAKTRALPILAVTAHAMRGDEKRILEAGCDAYVAKPIAYKEFLAQVCRLLATVPAAREE